MNCSEHFARFDKLIRLDRARIGRIESSVESFEAFCTSNDQLAAARHGSTYIQGSVACETTVKPLGSDEFDVDVVYPFRLGAFEEPDRHPRRIFNWFVKQLRSNAFYSERMTVKSRCVRINYAGDFHVDLIPGAVDLSAIQPIAIPDRQLAQWIRNDPRGFVDWFDKRSQTSGLRNDRGDTVLQRTVRYMKRWRDVHFSESEAISSILLTTTIAKHEASTTEFNPPLPDPRFQSDPCDLTYLFDCLRLTYDCVQRESSTAYLHPTMSDIDLSEGWRSDHEPRFLEVLSVTIALLERVIDSRESSEALNILGQLFGESFPSS